MHPRSKHRRIINCTNNRQRDFNDFLDTCAARGANCSTNHIIIRSTTRLKLRNQFNKKVDKQLFKKPYISKQRNVDIQNELETKLKKQFTLIKGTEEEKWSLFRDAVYHAESDVLYSGCVTRRHEE